MRCHNYIGHNYDGIEDTIEATKCHNCIGHNYDGIEDTIEATNKIEVP